MSLEKIDEMINIIKYKDNSNPQDMLVSNDKIELLKEIRPIVEQLEADKRELKADINKIMEVLGGLTTIIAYNDYTDNDDDYLKAKKLINEWKGGNNE